MTRFPQLPPLIRCSVVALVASAGASASPAPFAPAQLRCEYLDNPIGLDVDRSRLRVGDHLLDPTFTRYDRRVPFAALVANVMEQNNGHLDFGVLGSKYVLNALTDRGRADVAYRMAGQTTPPGWGWWIEQGATTL